MKELPWGRLDKNIESPFSSNCVRVVSSAECKTPLSCKRKLGKDQQPTIHKKTSQQRLHSYGGRKVMAKSKILGLRNELRSPPAEGTKHLLQTDNVVFCCMIHEKQFEPAVQAVKQAKGSSSTIDP
mmetsp:Transcript_25462/g.39903  ORF Transcript_25462/g.39903 Transcript_25462/m.39903 type:complete len:126 (-) Transcript_25462:63-440(-)